MTLVSAYQRIVVWYVVAMLFLYPYGLSLGEEASLRFSDPFAMLAIAVGAGAIILRQRVKIDRAFLGIAGAFILFELLAPFIGALGYRRPGDAVSAVRMAMRRIVRTQQGREGKRRSTSRMPVRGSRRLWVR